jgi:hypothetical protein
VRRPQASEPTAELFESIADDSIFEKITDDLHARGVKRGPIPSNKEWAKEHPAVVHGSPDWRRRRPQVVP